ncbi:hypothetical protein EIP86_001509 [Pleurotus ostreatoroseus]|nr:hypothetical protein EIP86_001509 [Pleurotus ostreatoroseus]
MFETLKTWIIVAALILILVKIVTSLSREYRLRKVMPPGPRGLPLLGNIFQVGELQWLRFTEWKEQYGTIFSLNLAGQPIVVLNDFTSAADLVGE